MTTRGRTFTQGLTFEIEASPQDCMTFEINGETFTRTVAQALERSESMAYREESERLICETFHLKPEEIAVVGDTYNDVVFARNNGGVAIGVLSGVSSEEDFRGEADYILDSVQELPGLIERMS